MLRKRPIALPFTTGGGGKIDFSGQAFRLKPPIPCKTREYVDIKTTQDLALTQKSTRAMRRRSPKFSADQRADNEESQQHGTCAQSAMPARQHTALIGNHALTLRATSHNQQACTQPTRSASNHDWKTVYSNICRTTRRYSTFGPHCMHNPYKW